MDSSIDIAISSAAVHWLTAKPEVPYGDGLFLSQLDANLKKILLKKAADDWEIFISARSKELKVGGLLFVTGLASEIDDQGKLSVSAADLFTVMRRVLKGMIAEKILSQHVYDDYIFPVVPRTLDEYLAPVCSEVWQVKVAKIASGTNAFYAAYQQHGNAQTYAKDYINFVRSFSESAMIAGLFSPGAISMDAKACSEVIF
ncbi:class I SAM-dependent methyltransferase [Piscirickettsia litoralis]|uniref:Methyltransferase type 11 domain-containing protein n=1 Tax=Piscirickettsia litoralis TaxID=1891921 RepID=A0ABX3A6S9_9GAMM|nr:hypothetical protein [Piscirickettsia litoralis]ODN43942.1 hypothetical protein BGC07_14930 [Piscirickettsia litoralis]